MANREAAGLDPSPPHKKRKPSNRTYDEDELYGGKLEDIWSTPLEVKSKKFNQYKTNFAKKDHTNVKSVINPTGGQSYNPALKDHKNLLKKVAKKEEEIVEKNLKDLKKVRPLLFQENKDAEVSNKEEESDDGGSDDNQNSEDESSSGSDQNPEKSLAVN